MFGESKNVQISTRLGIKLVSALLVFSFVTVSFSSTARAQKNKSVLPVKNVEKQKFTSDIKLDGFAVELFAGAAKISWKTSFEENMLGFRIWRDGGKGERTPVSEEMIGASLLKVGNGVLPAGSEYSSYDLTDSADVYYSLEAVDINGVSRWFGPIYPQINFDLAAAEKESEIIDQLKIRAKVSREQTEEVEFTAPPADTESFKAFESPETNLITNDSAALKIEVRTRGFYRVDAQSLAANGFNVAQSAYWKLFAGAVEQPMVVNADGSIEFYGQGVDTLQTDSNIYWLITDVTTGKRIKRVSQKYLQSAKNGFSRVTVERKDKINRISSILNGARENWYGAIVYPTALNQTLVVNDIAAENNQTATISVHLQGLTTVAHKVSVLLNGVSIGQINFSMYERIEWATSVPLSRLVEGTNTVTLQSLGGSQDINIIETIRINYPRALEAQDNRLDFSLNGGQSVKLRGFTNPQVRIFDVTNPAQTNELAPQSRLETDGTYSVTLNSVNNARLLTALGTSSEPLAPVSLKKNNASDLRNTANQAKFLVIAPVEYKALLQNFCNARNAGGMQTMFVDVEDIYDEFNSGVKSAESIRAFLQLAKQSWAVKPDFVMFVGDASVDPKNYSGFGGYAYNRVPTIFVDTWNMETVSDEMMADFNGDNIGELATGRLPAKDEAELQAMLEKVMNTQPLTRTEINQRGVHFVSDNNVDYNFTGGSRNMATFIPSTIAINYLDSGGQDAATVRNSIITRINTAPAIVNYFGHASIGSWSSTQIFRSIDAQNLSNSPGAPFMVLINCLNGDYAEANMTSVAEAVIKKQSGGASAVWASSGWNGAFDQEYMTRDFYKKVFTGMPLGEAARQTKMMYPIADLRRTYVFFGDPTQSLVTP